MKAAGLIAAAMILGSAARANNHDGWIHRDAQDTSYIYCWGDSATWAAFPPGCLGGGMMAPDSLWCDIEEMPFDSLSLPHDSSFFQWCTVEIGDAEGDDYLSCNGGGEGMMQFAGGVGFCFGLDSANDSEAGAYGVCGWDGSQWVRLLNAECASRGAFVPASKLYSAYALVKLSAVSGVAEQERGVRRMCMGGAALPDASIGDCYPDPFTGMGTFLFNMNVAGAAAIFVFNDAGMLVRRLWSGELGAGAYSIQWNAAGLQSGMYSYWLAVNSSIQTKRFFVTK